MATLEELAGDPHPLLGRLRASEPVAWLPVLAYGWSPCTTSRCG